MQTLHYSITINASKEKVWNTMLQDETYRKWTSVFNPTGSYFEGDWTTGSSIRFIGPDKDGTVSGMISRIKESRPFDFVSIQHLGEIVQGKETLWGGPGTPSPETFENYTFEEKDGTTEVLVDLTTADVFPEAYSDMFNSMWPKALEKLKELSEEHK